MQYLFIQLNRRSQQDLFSFVVMAQKILSPNIRTENVSVGASSLTIKNKRFKKGVSYEIKKLPLRRMLAKIIVAGFLHLQKTIKKRGPKSIKAYQKNGQQA